MNLLLVTNRCGAKTKGGPSTVTVTKYCLNFKSFECGCQIQSLNCDH